MKVVRGRRSENSKGLQRSEEVGDDAFLLVVTPLTSSHSRYQLSTKIIVHLDMVC